MIMKPLPLLVLFLPLAFLFSGCSPFTGGEAIETDLPPRSALLVIDVQKDFMLPQGKLPIDQAQAGNIIRNLNELLPVVVRHQIDVVYIGNEFKKSATVANWFRNHAAIENSAGAKLAEGLNVVSTNYFAKNRPDAFSNGEFDRFLREKKISKLIISGVFADQCVLATIKGAINRQYEVYALADAIGAKTDKHLARALRKYKQLGVNVLDSGRMSKLIEP